MSDWEPRLRAASMVAFLPTTDLERAASFFGEVLGLTVEEVNRFACVIRTQNVELRVTLVEQLSPQPFTVLGWEVADLDQTIASLVSRGVRPLRYEGFGQDERGVWTAPDGGQVMWFHDPDGNTLSVHQRRGG